MTLKIFVHSLFKNLKISINHYIIEICELICMNFSQAMIFNIYKLSNKYIKLVQKLSKTPYIQMVSNLTNFFKSLNIVN